MPKEDPPTEKEAAPASAPQITTDLAVTNGDGTTDVKEAERLAELEARAVAEATATADSAYVPSPALLNSATLEPLLEQIDGLKLADYQCTPSVYVAKLIPVKAAGILEVPIHVIAGGSVVEYEITTDRYDIGFGIVAKRDEGTTTVREMSRVDSHVSAVTGKFLVGTVPCALQFTFDNEFSWLREKQVSYKITVTPPGLDIIREGRKRRATSALSAIEEDAAGVQSQLDQTTKDRETLETMIKEMEAELEERKKSLQGAVEEEQWLEQRMGLRNKQKDALNKRLTEGWEDEKEMLEKEKAVAEAYKSTTK